MVETVTLILAIAGLLALRLGSVATGVDSRTGSGDERPR